MKLNYEKDSYHGRGTSRAHRGHSCPQVRALHRLSHLEREWRGLAGDEIEVTATPDGSYQARLTYIGNPVPIDRLNTPIIPAKLKSHVGVFGAASLFLPGQC